MDYDAIGMDIHNVFYCPFLLESTQVTAFAGLYRITSHRAPKNSNALLKEGVCISKIVVFSLILPSFGGDE